MAGVSLLAIPMGNAIPSGYSRLFFFLALVSAVVAVLLGIIGLITTRGKNFMRRVPAVIGMGLGGILTLLYALVNWLSIPFCERRTKVVALADGESWRVGSSLPETLR